MVCSGMSYRLLMYQGLAEIFCDLFNVSRNSHASSRTRTGLACFLSRRHSWLVEIFNLFMSLSAMDDSLPEARV